MPLPEHMTVSECPKNIRDEHRGGAPTTSRSGGPFVWFLGVSCFVLAIIVVLLAQQNRSFRAQLEHALQHHAAGDSRAHGAQRGAPLAVGDHLQPLTIFAPPISNNDPVPDISQPPIRDALRFAEAPVGTLLFLFGGGCEACDEMSAAVARLALAGNDLGIVVVGIQVDAAEPADLKHTDRGFLACGVADPRGTWLEPIVTVPGLALVDRLGTVRGVWWGVIQDAQEPEIHQVMVNLANVDEHRPSS